MCVGEAGPEMQGMPSRMHRDGKHLSHHVRHAPSLSWVPGEGTSCQKLEFLKQFHIKSDMYAATVLVIPPVYAYPAAEP